jgi:hypothetical protein
MSVGTGNTSPNALPVFKAPGKNIIKHRIIKFYAIGRKAKAGLEFLYGRFFVKSVNLCHNIGVILIWIFLYEF